ncbi:putative AC transposase, partial [Trifolium medium]|nr:putative AC transposase [Trifolium medium]
NLGRHLANRHPGYDKTGEAVSNSVTRPNAVVIKKCQAQGKSNQVYYDHLNWLLVRWLVLASLPPSTLEEKWLVNSYKFLNPSIQIWPSEKYRTVLDEVFRSMREDNFYMSVTCQWIDENWCFQKLLLDICRNPVMYPR